MTNKQISEREYAILYLSTLGESVTEGNIAEIIRTRHKMDTSKKTNLKGTKYYGN